MKKFFYYGVLLLFIVSLNSCYVNRSTVGDGPVGKAEAVKYSHAKQAYLFWGLVPLGHSSPAIPQDCGYQIKTSFNIVDAIINGITGGIVGTRNMKILVNKNSKCDPAVQRLQRQADKKKIKNGGN